MLSGARARRRDGRGSLPPDERLRQVLDEHVGQVLRGVAAFRLTAALVPLLDANGPDSPDAWRFVLAATAGVVALNVALWVFAPRIRRPGQGKALLAADLAVAVVVNLAAALMVPGGPGDPAAFPFWYVLQGTVAVTVAVRGPRCAVPVLLTGVPLQLGMARLGGTGAVPDLVARAALGALWLVLALVCAAMVVRILRLHAEVALGEGMEVGADREHVRTARSLHDTVLQTLEAIALRSPDDAVDPARRLREARAAAREQADDLRAAIQRRRLAEERRRPAPFPERLRDVVDEALRAGVDTDVSVDVGAAVPPAAAEAATDAVREALTNVAKHSGARRASVQVSDSHDGVLVVVEDEGRGFDPTTRGPGFGISQSIHGRISDVGGWSRVASRPGSGTSVRLWLPRTGSGTGRRIGASTAGGLGPVGIPGPAAARGGPVVGGPGVVGPGPTARRPVPPRTRAG